MDSQQQYQDEAYQEEQEVYDHSDDSDHSDESEETNPLTMNYDNIMVSWPLNLDGYNYIHHLVT